MKTILDILKTKLDGPGLVAWLIKREQHGKTEDTKEN
jgi:hypothetical protein